MPFLAHVASWHVARLGPNTFEYMLRVHNSLFHHVGLSNIKPCNGFVFSHSSSPPDIIASHFVQSLAEQLFAKEVYFC